MRYAFPLVLVLVLSGCAAIPGVGVLGFVGDAIDTAHMATTKAKAVKDRIAQ